MYYVDISCNAIRRQLSFYSQLSGLESLVKRISNIFMFKHKTVVYDKLLLETKQRR